MKAELQRDTQSRKPFLTAMNQCLQYCGSYAAMARHLKVSVRTVFAWRSGLSEPRKAHWLRFIELHTQAKEIQGSFISINQQRKEKSTSPKAGSKHD